MASPSVTQSGTWATFTTQTPSFTSPAITSPSDCLWLAMCMQANSAGAISAGSVSSAGVTWKNKARQTFAFSGIAYTVELWSAALIAQNPYGATTVTVNLSAKCDGIAGVFWAVTGDHTAGACTLDPNASLPAGGGQASTPPTVTFSTTNPDDLLLWVGGSDSESMQDQPNGWTNIGAIHVFPTNITQVAAAFLSVSSKQTNVSLAWTGNTDMVMTVAAETADAAAATKGYIIGMLGLGAT